MRLPFKRQLNDKRDEIDWQSLYEYNFDRVFKTALKIVRDRGLVEDVAHEAFLNAFLRITSLEDISKLDAWILSIAKNTAKNLLTRKINYNNKGIPYEIIDTLKVSNDIIQLSERNNPEVLYEENEVAKEILDCIKGLDKLEQRILHLKYNEDLTYVVIAEQMNMKQGTIRMKALRAREEIYKKLNWNVGKEV